MTCLNYTAPEGASPLVEQKPRVKRVLVHGCGKNDFTTPIQVNGKLLKSYIRWANMLKRCYSTNDQKENPTYVDCTVAEAWHSFTTFEKWFTENYVDGYHLDKDTLFPGNKVYSAETCVFIPQTLNNLLMDCSAARGEHPLGVYFHKASKKYMARVCVAGQRQSYLGSFPTPLEAHQAWQLAKAAIIEAFPTTDPRIRAALDKRAAQLRDDHAHGRITVKL